MIAQPAVHVPGVFALDGSDPSPVQHPGPEKCHELASGFLGHE